MIEILEVPHGTPLYEELTALRQALLRTPLGMKYTPADLAEEKDDIHIAAREDGRIIGSALLKIIDAQTGELKRMAVADGLQGRGVGKLLLTYVEDRARALGHNRLMMHAREAAWDFYERMGYRRYGDTFIQATLLHVKMEKILET